MGKRIAMNNTIKMPRKHNRRYDSLQRNFNWHKFWYWSAIYFFSAMCIWGTTEFAEWLDQIIHENKMLKVERQIEANQLYVRLTADKVAERRKEDECKEYVKRWQEKNPDLAGIMASK